MEFLVPTSEIADFLGIADAGLDPVRNLAETLVAKEIGRSSLAESTGAATVKVDRWSRERLPVGDAPIVSLTSVTEDGNDITAMCEGRKWQVRRTDGLLFAVGRTYVLSWKAGWAAVENLPEEIKQAVVITAVEKRSNPTGKQSEKIGDYSYSYGTGRGAEIPAIPTAALDLISDWRRPKL